MEKRGCVLCQHVNVISIHQYVLILQRFSSFFIKFIGWHWLAKLYRFQVHSYTACYLCTALCVHHPESGLLPSPFIPPMCSSSPSQSPSPDSHHALLSVSTCPLSLLFAFCLLNSTHPHAARYCDENDFTDEKIIPT